MNTSPQISITAFNFEDRKLYQLSFNIRTEVFIEEQKVDPAIERENEEEARYYLLFLEETAIATARWRKTDKGCKLERFAMLMKYRNQGLGSVLLDKILEDVLPLKQPVYLHAQVNAVNYYLRKGFKIIGDVFSEANILHYTMILPSETAL